MNKEVFELKCIEAGRMLSDEESLDIYGGDLCSGTYCGYCFGGYSGLSKLSAVINVPNIPRVILGF